MTSDFHGRRVRVARGIAAASVASLVALASHVVGGGTVPPLVVAAAVVFSWPLGVLLIGRRSSLPRQALVIAIAQAILHLLATVSSTPGAGLSLRPDGMGMGMGMGTGVAAPAMPDMAAPSPLMWAMHAAAAVATIAAWRHGERIAQDIADRIAMTVVRVLRVVALLPADTPQPIPVAPTFARAALVASRPAARRGPPLLVE